MRSEELGGQSMSPLEKWHDQETWFEVKRNALHGVFHPIDIIFPFEKTLNTFRTPLTVTALPASSTYRRIPRIYFDILVPSVFFLPTHPPWISFITDLLIVRPGTCRQEASGALKICLKSPSFQVSWKLLSKP